MAESGAAAKMLPALSDVHRHIPSLKIQSAVAAKPILHPPSTSEDDASRQFKESQLARLNERLLHYLANLYTRNRPISNSDEAIWHCNFTVMDAVVVVLILEMWWIPRAKESRT